MAIATNLGFPRIGEKRELKESLERFWKRESDEPTLLKHANSLQVKHWQWQQEAGIEHLPVGDFSLYDHVLDWVVRVGGVPHRYSGLDGLAQYFAMARGHRGVGDVSAMEMTKWFDTNYHYIVPEWTGNQTFEPHFEQLLSDVALARTIGGQTRPVVLGPVSLLRLGKTRKGEFDPITLLDRLLPVYESLFVDLQAAGVEWVQLDEPCLVLDLDEPTRLALRKSTERLVSAAPGLQIVLATYFGELRENLPLAMALPVQAVHLDLVRGPGQLTAALPLVGTGKSLSLGLVDGRNVWRTNLSSALSLLEEIATRYAS
jgi:5-methyltetrahydropteroyltriglutamate--homocysteine methyltransferase